MYPGTSRIYSGTSRIYSGMYPGTLRVYSGMYPGTSRVYSGMYPGTLSILQYVTGYLQIILGHVPLYPQEYTPVRTRVHPKYTRECLGNVPGYLQSIFGYVLGHPQSVLGYVYQTHPCNPSSSTVTKNMISLMLIVVQVLASSKASKSSPPRGQLKQNKCDICGPSLSLVRSKSYPQRGQLLTKSKTLLK